MTKVSLRFDGGAPTKDSIHNDGVTGSKVRLDIQGAGKKSGNNAKLFLDMGQVVGGPNDPLNELWKFEPNDGHDLDGIVITHAHIDHVGKLLFFAATNPSLRFNIFCTLETARLLKIILNDTLKIYLEQVRVRKDALKSLNTKNPKGSKDKGFDPGRVEKKKLTRYPEPSEEDVERILSFVKVREFGDIFKLTHGVRAKFLNAGHILGSAQTLITVNEKFRILDTGDLGNSKKETFHEPPQVAKELVDVMLIEGTYGGQNHANRASSIEKLANEIRDTIMQGGKVLIPAFSLDRTQEIIGVLGTILDKIPKETSIYTDSVMGEAITQVYFDCLQNGRAKETEVSLGFQNMVRTGRIKPLSFSDRAQVITSKAPNITIASAGMCDAGPIVAHLSSFLEDPKNTLIFMSYSSPSSRAGKIAELSNQKTNDTIIKIAGKSQSLKARVVKLSGFSAHADEQSLIEYIGATEFSPESRILIKHCTFEAGTLLREAILNRDTWLNEDQVEVAIKGKTYRFKF